MCPCCRIIYWWWKLGPPANLFLEPQQTLESPLLQSRLYPCLQLCHSKQQIQCTDKDVGDKPASKHYWGPAGGLLSELSQHLQLFKRHTAKSRDFQDKPHCNPESVRHTSTASTAVTRSGGFIPYTADRLEIVFFLDVSDVNLAEITARPLLCLGILLGILVKKISILAVHSVLEVDM